MQSGLGLSLIVAVTSYQNVSTVAVAVRAITLIPAGKILLRSPILEKALLNSSPNSLTALATTSATRFTSYLVERSMLLYNVWLMRPSGVMKTN